MLPAGLALLLDLLEPPVERLHALGEQAAVGFELCLARTTIADAATALTFEVGPAAHQARRDVLELRELHFELAFVAARALREDVEDQPRAIEHAALDEFFEIALLRRRERMIEQHHVGVVLDRGGANFIGLAAAHEESRIGAIAPPADADHGNGAGRARELLELEDVFGVRGCADAKAHEHGPLTCAWSLEQFEILEKREGTRANAPVIILRRPPRSSFRLRW